MTQLIALDGVTVSRPTVSGILEEALEPLIGELMLIDPLDLVELCRAERHRSIGDLVESAAELLFAAPAFRYGGAAEVRMSWGSPPAVVLDMEFRHDGMVVLFRLCLGAEPSVTDVVHLLEMREAGGHAAGPVLAQRLTRLRQDAPCA